MTAHRTTPERIVDGGAVEVGRFDRPFRTANLGDAPARHLLCGLRRGPLAPVERAWRRMRLKQWHYASIATPRYFLGAVVFDAGYIGVGFAYLVDRATGEAREYSKMAPLARGVTVAANSTDGTSRFAAAGFGEISFANDGASGRRLVHISLAGDGDRPALEVDYEMIERPGEHEPMVAVAEPQPGRWVYTHKTYGLPAGGSLRCGDWEERTEPGQALAGIDWNRGFRPTETVWNWAAAAGRDQAGRVVGFTFSAPLPPPGRRNRHHERSGASESVVWLDGKLHDLGAVRFDYDPRRILSPWRLHDDAGLVDLEFEPRGERVEDLDLVLVVSRFHQPYGIFRGTLRAPGGDTHRIDDVYGVVEEHFARW